MPGNVSVSPASTVLPDFLSRAFTETRVYEGRINEYPDGNSQRVADVANSRRSWQRTAGLGESQMATLEAFYLGHIGLAFWFYPFTDGTYDATGVSTSGRIKVRFDEEFTRSVEIGAGSAQFRLLEVA
jgi:hypothetical protein